MINYRDNYYGSILDPIHGDIKLSEIEKWCISHPLFSRLRTVKQNTFLYYVFPSALHTRFEHSIGVMHIAGKIFDACKENYATGTKKKEKYGEKEESSFFDLSKLSLEKEEIYFQELRLAALLHDIGHGPLSHLFDKFLMSRESFFNCINSDEILKKYSNSFEEICPKDNNIEHEHISCLFVIKILQKLKETSTSNTHKFSNSAKEIINKISIERIVKLIEVKFNVADDFVDENGNNYSNFFSTIISGFPIDSDRMDYLLRDSYFSGVNYGLYDINRLFASFMATEHDKSIKLTIKESGLDSVLRFIQSRTHLFNQVYFHKTNRAANTMLSASTNSTKDKIKLLDNTTVEALMDFYIINSDEYFISKTVKEKLSIDEHEKLILSDLRSRKLFKRLYEFKIILSQDNFDKVNKVDEIVKTISSKLKDLQSEGIFSYIDNYKNEAYKDSDNKAIQIAKKDKATSKYKIDSEWSKVNLEFMNSNVISVMTRIYTQRTFTNSDDFKILKQRVIDHVKNEINLLEKI